MIVWISSAGIVMTPFFISDFLNFLNLQFTLYWSTRKSNQDCHSEGLGTMKIQGDLECFLEERPRKKTSRISVGTI